MNIGFLISIAQLDRALDTNSEVVSSSLTRGTIVNHLNNLYIMVLLIIALAASIALVNILLDHVSNDLNYKFDKESWVEFMILCFLLFGTGFQFYRFAGSPNDQLDVYRGKTTLKITKEVVGGKVIKLDSMVIYKNK